MRLRLRYVLVLFSCLFTLGTLGCQLQTSIEDTASSVSITGSISNYSSMSSSGQGSLSSCSQEKVHLYLLDNQGQKQTLLGSSTVDATGEFEFKSVKELGVQLSQLTSSTPYLLEFSCGSHTYRRFVTDVSDQKVSEGTTLLGWLTQTNLSNQVVGQGAATWAEFYNQLNDASSMTIAFSTLNSNSELKTRFQDVFGVAPNILLNAVPQISASSVAATFNEEVGKTISVQAQHWSPTYTLAYDWRIGSEVLSNSSSFTYTPTANSQGTHQLRLFIGQDDGSGEIDWNQPYLQKVFSVNVDNTLPPTVPAAVVLSDEYTNSTLVQFQLTTGPLVDGIPQNCKSFSKLAIGEEGFPAIGLAPLLAASYSETCTSANTEDYSFTLSGTEGRRSLRIWARDASGNISLLPKDLSVVYDITAPAFTLSSFDEGQTFAGGSVQEISWSSVEANPKSNPVSIDYSVDAGANWINIASALSDDGSYDWTLPNVDSTQALIRLSATDLAGNSGQTVSQAQFTIDSTAPSPPTLSLDSSSITNSTTVDLDVGCLADHNKVLLSASSTQPTGGAVGWVTCETDMSFEVGTGDGTKNIYVWSKDLAGNISGTSNSVSVTLDQTLPVLSFTTLLSGTYQGGSDFDLVLKATETNISTSQSFNFEYSSDNGTTWSSLGSLPSSNGPLSAADFTFEFSWPVIDTTQAKLRASVTDQAGNAATPITSGVFAIDSSLPEVSSLVVNNNNPTSVSSYIPLNFSASDNQAVTDFCVKYNDFTAPSAGDSCWVNVSVTGEAVSTALTVTDYFFRVGLSGGNYDLALFVKDKAGNISTLSETSGVDIGEVIYSPGEPPEVHSVTASSTTTPGSPLSATDLEIPMGSDVYIQWKVSSSVGLAASPINIYYSTDDSNWQVVAQNLSEGEGANCTLQGANTGCYKWASGSPSNGFFRIRVSATDLEGFSSLNSSMALNSTVFQFLAGNTEIGTNGSASAGIFLNNVQADNRKSDYRSLVVHPNGTIFVRDAARGIVIVDPEDGLLKVFIPKSTSSTGDGGPAASATVKTPMAIVLDSDNNLLIYDHQTIRKVNLAASPPTISTLIGGLAPLETGDDVANARNLFITSPAKDRAYDSNLYPLPNGDLLFRSTTLGGSTNQLRWYHAADNSISTINFSGTNVLPEAPSQEISTCSIQFSAPVLSSLGELEAFVLSIMTSPSGSCTYDSHWNHYNALFDADGSFIENLSLGITSTGHTFLGKDFKTYAFYRNSLFRFDSVSKTWDALANAGGGVCDDGTAFSNCRLDVEDIFIDSNSRIYFLERGRIRTVTDADDVLTIMGQVNFFGDGLNPLSARFGDLSSIGVWNDGTNNRVVSLDNLNHRLREFELSSSSVISTIAGLSYSGIPDTAESATTQPIWDTASTSTSYYFGLDTDGNIYLPNYYNTIGKLSRATGKWSNFVGNGANWYYESDGDVGSDIRFQQGNSYPHILGINGNELLVYASLRTPSQQSYPFMKLFDLSTTVMSTLAGFNSPDVDKYTWCADGTLLSNCLIPNSEIGRRGPAAYDSISSSWLVATTVDSKIRKLTPGGNMETYLNVPSSFYNFALRKAEVAGTVTEEIIYYCDRNVSPSVIRKYDMLTSTLTNLSWPIPSMSCTGQTMIYDESRDSLIFIYTQNGLFGIAEFLNP